MPWQPRQVQKLGYVCRIDGLPVPMIKAARASGQLNLSNRGLQSVPDKVWRLNDPDEDDKGKRGFSTDVVHEEEAWWEFVDLTKLILASNQITSLSNQVERLPALTVLDLHDNALTSLPDEIGKELKRVEKGPKIMIHCKH